jgi:hypothetical protein
VIRLVSCDIASIQVRASFDFTDTYLADTATLLTENLLSVGCTDDDVGDGGSNSDLDAGVTFLGKLALEELVELGVEDSVGDELSALRDVDAAESGSWGCGSGHAGLLFL